MERSKLIQVFEELLDEWETLQEVVNNDRGTDISNDQERLDSQKSEFQRKFNEALSES